MERFPDEEISGPLHNGYRRAQEFFDHHSVQVGMSSQMGSLRQMLEVFEKARRLR